MEQLEQEGYSVRLDVFSGPIALLLRLIEAEQLDISAISLARVADQYLEYIRSNDAPSGAELAAFIEVAARLLLIKSRLLLPSDPTDALEDEGDPAEALIRRLEDYRCMRDAAGWLAGRREQGLRSFSREPALPEEPLLVPRPSTPQHLLMALQRALGAPEEEDEGDTNEIVSPVSVSLPAKLRTVLRMIWRQARVRFAELIADATTRSEVVVTFLAVLELVRRGRATASQEELFGDIVIARPEATSQHSVESTAPADPAAASG